MKHFNKNLCYANSFLALKIPYISCLGNFHIIFAGKIYLKIKKFQATLRSSCRKVFCKKGALKYFTKLTGKHRCQSPFFIKVETLAQVFSCEFCEVFKNTYLQRTPLLAASEYLKYFFKYKCCYKLKWRRRSSEICKNYEREKDFIN